MIDFRKISKSIVIATTVPLLANCGGSNTTGQDLVTIGVASAGLVLLDTLSGEDLSGQYLRGIDISGKDLRNANFSNADLREANLRNGNFENANFSNTDLRNADLRNANLKNANFKETDLRGADLRGVDLDHANFKDVKLTKVDLRNVDLTNVDLSKVDMAGVYLKDSDLPPPPTPTLTSLGSNGNDLSGKDLRDANLQNANLTNTNPLTTPFDGLYRPENGTYWSCREDQLGMDGGTLGIVDGRLEGVENSCRLSNPQRLQFNKILYKIDCFAEGEEYSDYVVIEKISTGISINRHGETVFWDSCDN